MSINEMESKVTELRELRRMADELAAEITAVEDEIKAHMTAVNTDKLHGSSFRITPLRNWGFIAERLSAVFAQGAGLCS